MGFLGTLRDPRGAGRHFTSRMDTILDVCKTNGLLFHDERIDHRDGSHTMRRVDDIVPDRKIVETGRWEVYGLQVNPRLLRRVLQLGPQFSYALNLEGVRVEVEGGVVLVRVPRLGVGESQMVTYSAALAIDPALPLGMPLLGLDDVQRQLILDMTSPNSVHAAVIGMTGSGKSTLMRTMVLSMQMTGGARVAIMDPTGGLEPLSGHPTVWRGGIFDTAAKIEMGLRVLADLVSAGRDRNGQLLFVIIDEVPDLVAQRPGIRDYIGRLTQAGRHAGIHVVMGAQHPLASELGSNTLRNVGARLVGRVADAGAAYQATGRRDSGAELLQGKGDFLAVTGNMVRHFQAALPEDELLERWRQTYPPRQPRLPVIAKRTVERRVEVPAEPTPLPVPEEGLEELMGYVAENGKLPSQYWVRKTLSCGIPKAKRLLEAAERRMRVSSPGDSVVESRGLGDPDSPGNGDDGGGAA
jgi:DNA segregation ATPase FtsK/SpoIIIE, S-DNA-T family